MFLLITALAAIISTVIWYVNAPEDNYRLNILSLIFWGATLMWLVDHIVAFMMEGGEILEISLDATLLGFTVVICGLAAWLIALLISDPKGVFKKLLGAKK